MKKLVFIFCFNFFLISCDKKTEKESSPSSVNQKSNKHFEYDSDGNILVEGFIKDKKKYGVWKFYKNKKIIEVKKFNEDTLQYVLDAEDYNYKGILLKRINSTIPIPNKWNTNLSFDNPNTLLTSVKDCEEDKLYCPNIIVTSEEQTSPSLKNHVLDFKKQIKANFKDVEIIELKKNPLLQDESFQMKYTYVYNNVEIIYIIFWIKNNNYITTFCGSCEKSDYLKYSYLFYEIGNSIKKIKPSFY